MCIPCALDGKMGFTLPQSKLFSFGLILVVVCYPTIPLGTCEKAKACKYILHQKILESIAVCWVMLLVQSDLTWIVEGKQYTIHHFQLLCLHQWFWIIQKISVHVFDSVVFDCMAEGFGFVTIIWEKDNYKLPSATTMQTNITLIIKYKVYREHWSWF